MTKKITGGMWPFSTSEPQKGIGYVKSQSPSLSSSQSQSQSQSPSSTPSSSSSSYLSSISNWWNNITKSQQPQTNNTDDRRIGGKRKTKKAKKAKKSKTSKSKK
jgi:hypothetical protein